MDQSVSFIPGSRSLINQTMRAMNEKSAASSFATVQLVSLHPSSLSVLMTIQASSHAERVPFNGLSTSCEFVSALRRLESDKVQVHPQLTTERCSDRNVHSPRFIGNDEPAQERCLSRRLYSPHIMGSDEPAQQRCLGRRLHSPHIIGSDS